jgi:hypothetical protein
VVAALLAQALTRLIARKTLRGRGHPLSVYFIEDAFAKLRPAAP